MTNLAQMYPDDVPHHIGIGTRLTGAHAPAMTYLVCQCGQHYVVLVNIATGYHFSPMVQVVNPKCLTREEVRTLVANSNLVNWEVLR